MCSRNAGGRGREVVDGVASEADCFGGSDNVGGGGGEVVVVTAG